MNADKRIHDSKLAHWITLFQKQAESGLTVADWCSQNGLSKNAYYYWKRIAKEAYTDSVIPEIVPIDITQPSDSATTVPLLPKFHNSPELHNLHNSRELANLANNHANSSVSVFNDIMIDIGPSASDELISRLIEVIRHA